MNDAYFICVFSEDDRDTMLKSGFHLFKVVRLRTGLRNAYYFLSGFDIQQDVPIPESRYIKMNALTFAAP